MLFKGQLYTEEKTEKSDYHEMTAQRESDAITKLGGNGTANSWGQERRI